MIAILARESAVDEALARRALAAVPYPTPDIVLRRLGNALLGTATRPEFVEESHSSDGATVAVLTGRIDNAAELHRELAAAGTPPFSMADADVLVAAFRALGPEAAVNRFRGAFAGIVTDGQTLWCFRDHIGFRPMFYRDDATAFVVAGEARPVTVAARITEEPDLEVLERIFYGGLPSNTPAALKGVSRLAQGRLLRAGRTAGVTLDRYWRPWELLETARMSEAEARARFLELLARASVRSLAGDDVVLLSGGLDSPAVAAYAAPEHLRRTGRPLGALTAVFPDLPAVDERAYTELVADRFGMALHTYRAESRALDDVEEWSRRFATPVPTLSIPEVAEAYTRARELGFRNVITGEFAELTYGKWPHALAHLLLHGRFRALLDVIRAEHARGASRRTLLADTLTAFVPGRIVNRYLVARGRNMMHKAPPWISVERYDPNTPRGDYMMRPRDRWRALQLWGTEGSTVTMEADAICAAICGVTIRRPLADIDLWEFFLSLPAQVKFPTLQWKSLARRSLRGVLPDEILDRTKKTVFDDHVMQQVDYPTLERLLSAPRIRIPGVDYALLAERIAGREMGFHEWLRARELARVHAFLSAY